MSVLLLGLGMWLWLSPTSRRRVVGPSAAGRRPDMPLVAAGVAGVGVLVLVGGWWGMVLGPGVALGAWAGLRRLAAAEAGDREAIVRHAPDAIDCLASCLAAGAPVWTAMAVVAEAFDGPVAGMLQRCVARHDLGAPHAETFAELRADPLLAPVGRVLERSVESGSALTSALAGCVDQMRAARTADLERRARAVGVKAVLPLAVCFLPAFIVLAVVPIVGSLVAGLF